MSKSLLPRLLLEDYMSMLRGLVLLAWLAFSLGLLTQIGIRTLHPMGWPVLADFSFSYNAVLLEFGLNTLALTSLLFYRNWYERVPRESAQRVRTLLAFVIFWFSLHLFAAFHITGSVQGPLLALLPVLLIAALVFCPDYRGWLLAAYLVLGFAGVYALEQQQLIAPQGLLARHFQFSASGSGLSTMALATVLSVALLLAIVLRRYMFPQNAEINPVQRLDLDTGLFTRAFLEHRLAMEIGRVKRQGDSAIFMLIEVGKLTDEQLARAAGILVKQVRLGSDTPALYRSGTLAVLLAGAKTEAAATACERIAKAVGEATENPGESRSAAVVLEAGDITPAECLNLAETQLMQQQPGHSPAVVTQ